MIHIVLNAAGIRKTRYCKKSSICFYIRRQLQIITWLPTDFLENNALHDFQVEYLAKSLVWCVAITSLLPWVVPYPLGESVGCLMARLELTPIQPSDFRKSEIVTNFVNYCSDWRDERSTISIGWEVSKRLSYIECNWPYFIGFGLPLHVLTTLAPSFIGRFVVNWMYFSLFMCVYVTRTAILQALCAFSVVSHFL